MGEAARKANGGLHCILCYISKDYPFVVCKSGTGMTPSSGIIIDFEEDVLF